jgi:DNA-directed RNA polymerase, mitochondrial
MSFLQINPILTNSLMKQLIFDPKMLPMVVPPVPWTSIDSGGYLIYQNDLIKRTQDSLHVERDREENMNMLKRMEASKNYPVLDAINVLSSCAWKINKPILDLIINVFTSNGDKSLEIPCPKITMKQNFEKPSVQFFSIFFLFLVLVN